MSILPLGNDNDLDDTQIYNRANEILFMSNELKLTKNGSTPVMLLTGINGIGKTTLLKKLKRDFEDDFLVVYMDLSKIAKHKSKSFNRFDFMKLFYKSLNEVYKIDVINNIEEDYSKFADFVMDLPQQIYNENNEDIGGVLIFIDEFQMMKQLDDVNSFLWYIRSVIQSQKNIAYVFSGSMGVRDDLISDIAGQNGAFGGRILNVNIKPFSLDTTRNYLNEKASYLKFTGGGFERFYKCTNGIPYYINTFARLLPPNVRLDEEKVVEEFGKALHYLVVHLTNEWYKLSKQEQRIIMALVENPLRRIEIANELGVTSGAIGASLKTLQSKLLIELVDDKYEIYDSVFKAWLKKEHP